MAWRNIVVTQHCKVSMKMNLLVVQTDDDTVQIPIDDIGMVLFATTQAVITTSAMASLLERDIKVGSARKVAHFGSWPSMER